MCSGFLSRQNVVDLSQWVVGFEDQVRQIHYIAMLAQPVGNGKYVYDISRWISSHPGGQSILFSVAGTDITNDYWNDETFDKEFFIPAETPLIQSESRIPVRATRSRVATSMISDYSSSNSRDSFASHRVSTDQQMRLAPGLFEEDWKHILKARRTHVHTTLAVRRLANLIVGEVTEQPDTFNLGQRTYFSNPTGRPFSRFEFRRYAITEKRLLTTAGSSEQVKPVYRLRFCLLYPHDSRDNEPIDGFLPGECIEIQMRSGKSEPVSRYYTPISGTLSEFEIAIKVVPGGFMSRLLTRQKLGDRQIKIRGPFGATLLSPQKPLSVGSNQWVPDTLVLIGGGSGLSPLLQLIQFLLLPKFVPLTAAVQYVPNSPDELAFSPGHTVIYFDGWAVGQNTNTNQTGFFPLAATYPRLGVNVRTRVILINSSASFDDIFGLEILEGAILAYPDVFSAHHFVARGFESAVSVASIDPNDFTQRVPKASDSSVELPCGIVHDGKISQAEVASLLEDEFANERRSKRVVVCGSPKFESDVADYLGEIGVHGPRVQILPHDHWVGDV
ncbi:hypothetical protein HK096_010513 [Nowakowskiella sp. JEL0078]|nr:hypothetical protein HK096_010513 [Nowakowskiella sp. JEL0078]